MGEHAYLLLTSFFSHADNGGKIENMHQVINSNPWMNEWKCHQSNSRTLERKKKRDGISVLESSKRIKVWKILMLKFKQK